MRPDSQLGFDDEDEARYNADAERKAIYEAVADSGEYIPLFEEPPISLEFEPEIADWEF